MIRYTTHSLLDTRVAVSATVPSVLKTERAIALGLWRGPREDDVGVGAVSAGLAWQPAEPPHVRGIPCFGRQDALLAPSGR